MCDEKFDIAALNWGTRIKVRMAAIGLTGRALAAEAGITETYLSGILSGKRGYECSRERVEEALLRLEAAREAQLADSEQG